MNFGNQLPPKQIDARVKEFCRQISNSTLPVFVRVEPEARARMLECYQNVATKVVESGGSQVYGWEISEAPGIHLEAQFHSVWRSPSGDLIDVTPEEFRQKRILFLEDPSRSYDGKPVPHQRFALGDPVLVARFWVLSDSLASITRDLVSAGFRPGDPVFRHRIGAGLAELQAIRERLQARSAGQLR